MFAGVIFFSLTIGSLTTLLNELDQKNTEFENKLEQLETIAGRFGIRDKKLLRKLTNCIKYRIYSKDDSFNELIDTLPPKVASGLSTIIYQPLVKGVKVLDGADPDLLHAIGPYLQKVKLNKNEFIFYQGEYSGEIYFIKKGEVGLALPEFNNEIFLRIKEGDYFGETDILYATARTFSVMATTQVELLSLDRKNFIHIFFKQFRQIGAVIKNYAERRFAKQIKTYDLFKDIAKEFYDKRSNTISNSSKFSKKIKTRLENEYLPFISRDTMTEIELKFSTSFIERNKEKLPSSFQKHRGEEDILSDNVCFYLFRTINCQPS